jgi:hypothetical protein
MSAVIDNIAAGGVASEGLERAARSAVPFSSQCLLRVDIVSLR